MVHPRAMALPVLPVLVTLLTTLLSACAGQTPLNYYLLDARPGAVLRGGEEALAIAIVDLEVPQYLERFQLARRVDANRLVYASADQWGEPLRKNLSRVLALQLGAVLATPDVATPHQRLTSEPDLRVQVHLERFEPGADGHVELLGRWQVIDAASGAVRSTEVFEYRSPAPVAAADHGAAVEALEIAFAAFGERIARDLVDVLEAGA